MKNKRIEQIKIGLNGLGTKAEEVYTNQEIVDSLIELQGALAKGVFEKTHAENLRDRDIVIHFEALAKEYGLDQTEEFLRFKKNMGALGYTIGSFIKGMKGEKIARRALKLLSFDKGVSILYNVQLDDGDTDAEYDAIVIAPYGLFVVEVKNWSSSVVINSNGLVERNDDSGIVYDLVGRMDIKQALLREYIGADFPENYQSVLVFPDEKVKVEDHYNKISVVCGGGVSQKIREFNAGSNLLTDDQRANLKKAITEHHKVQKTSSPVNCDEIINDYAVLMACIEEASMKTVTSIQKDEPKSEHEQPDIQSPRASKAKWIRHIDWKKTGKCLVSAAPVMLPMIVYGLSQFQGTLGGHIGDGKLYHHRKLHDMMGKK